MFLTHQIFKTKRLHLVRFTIVALGKFPYILCDLSTHKIQIENFPIEQKKCSSHQMDLDSLVRGNTTLYLITNLCHLLLPISLVLFLNQYHQSTLNTDIC